MRKTHYVVIQTIYDPAGLQIKGVRDTRIQAEDLELALKQLRAGEANQRRQELFNNGHECGPWVLAKSYDQYYEIREVPE